MNETDNTDKKTDKDWLFKPGESGNPEGRPKGQKNYLTLLEEALEKQAQKEKVSFYDKLAEWCFRYPKTATAILKKFIPDKTSTEISGADGEPIVINLIPVSTKQDIDNLESNND